MSFLNTKSDSTLTPEQAWAPYEAEGKEVWTIEHAAHLYRRAGFGADQQTLEQAAGDGLAKTVKQLLNTQHEAEAVNEFDSQMDHLAMQVMGGGDPRRLSAWWLYRMRFSPSPLREKMTLFWHGHFATSAAKVVKPRLMLKQYRLLQQHALGDFAEMVQGISRDPAMLIWLDSKTNSKLRPNENYAREILELFCLGVGNYTEKDIKEIARCFTGWGLRGERFVFNKYQHDEGEKRFFGASGNMNGDEAVEVISKQPAAARFIARKLVRFFVAEEPVLDDAMIEPLAVQLRENGFKIQPVMRTILSSRVFYSDHAMGCMVRSPIELALGLLTSFDMTTDFNKLANSLDQLGHAVFFPPNVKGWDGGRTWINGSTLLMRANMVHRLMVNGDARSVKGTLVERLQRDGVQNGEQLIAYLEQLLLPVALSAGVRAELVAMGRGVKMDDAVSVGQMIHAFATQPEFHLY